MIFKNITVKKPDNCVVYAPKNYVYYTAEKIYNKEKQYNLNKRVAIGRMIEGDNIHMNPNENAIEFFPEWFESMDEPEFSCSLKIGNTIIIKSVMEYLGISGMLDSCFDEKESNLIKDIIQYMTVMETSAMQHFPDEMRNMPIFSNKIYSDSTISRLFSDDIPYYKQDKFLCEWNEVHKTESIYISYDGSNINNKSDGIEIAEFGHAKDDRDTPIVNLSYATDQTTGTPLFFELYPGSIPDMSQLPYAVERSKEYGHRNIGFILDRGYYSLKNLKEIDEAGHDVIVMVKTNLSKIKNAIAENQMNVKDKAEAFIAGHKVYGTTISFTISDTFKKEYYMHIYYDGEEANKQRVNKLSSYEEMDKELNKRIREKCNNRKEDLKSYAKSYKLEYDDDGYLKSYQRDSGKIQNKIDLMGYFVLVTSKEMTAAEALDIYRNRDIVEKMFRSLKTEFEYDNFKVHSYESMQAKTFVVFLASIVRNEIFQRTKELKDKSKKEYTIPSIIREMNKLEVVIDSKNKYVRRFGTTKKQKDILSQFNIGEKEINQLVNDINKRII